MTQQISRISRSASVILVDKAVVNILKIMYDETKKELPNAQIVTITLQETYDDNQPNEPDASYDYTEGGNW